MIDKIWMLKLVYIVFIAIIIRECKININFQSLLLLFTIFGYYVCWRVFVNWEFFFTRGMSWWKVCFILFFLVKQSFHYKFNSKSIKLHLTTLYNLRQLIQILRKNPQKCIRQMQVFLKIIFIAYSSKK